MPRTTPPRPIDVTAVLPELAAHTRETTRLHPRPGAPDIAESSIGGPLLWPASEPWPTCTAPRMVQRSEPIAPALVLALQQAQAEREARQGSGRGGRRSPEELALLDEASGRRGASIDLIRYTTHWYESEAHEEPNPLVAVAQLHARDIPTVGFPSGTDLLQVLWCPTDHQDLPGQPRFYGGPYVHLVWRRASDLSSAPGSVPPQPRDTHDPYMPTPCVLHPEQVTEYQYADLLPEALCARLDAQDEQWLEETDYAYQYDLSIAPGFKAGGWASWHLTDPASVNCRCGASMDLLLSFDSSEWDGGSKSWRPIEDAEADHVGACTPTGLSPGRWGALRIFICPTDPTHPHLLNIQ
ncbi:hypothetical protein [Streptomyces nigrescens]|uniref:DUF1963 domain-containing protein n=1 Tax=Streptomyces nigrescens TaxID=1920 RepID=A0ABY7IU94_STRNI|nr:hypothetical protein [Streptomyces nigrescens]WAU02518.1 hypothetical protein STRNI_000565 [Streptomyces nigrescens]